jgi:hypothetical protein
LEIIYATGIIRDIITIAAQAKIEIFQEVSESVISKGNLIASGASGKVFQGSYKKLPSNLHQLPIPHLPETFSVAIKQFSDENINFDVNEFKREVAVMTLLRHPYLVTCFGALVKKSEMMIVTGKSLWEGTF